MTSRIANPAKLSWRTVLGLLVLLSGVGVAISQGRQQEKAPLVSAGPDEWKRALQDEVDIATARVQGKRADVRLAKSRLALVREVFAGVERNFKRRIVPENSVFAGRMDVEAHESLVEMREAELREREIRLAAAKRALENGSASGAMAPAHRDESPLRLDWLERRVVDLEHQNMLTKRAAYSAPR